ncbi:uncharacterized protein LY79DRAFT_355498 [Colletotrichum navitas]|uniref:Uncharacterized protein n=1 Tax=Colletotrichum navitas TaxID=681940 RepID=A0AAD8V9A1_9PEZI|nr:uncharacterized protein LY79DRAFT_355498 [Colletotrichum navitas]KAK1597754.1 hypothetical protein LY79DRAFT_355498 [Colletotrichum navitas]
MVCVCCTWMPRRPARRRGLLGLASSRSFLRPCNWRELICFNPIYAFVRPSPYCSAGKIRLCLAAKPSVTGRQRYRPPSCRTRIQRQTRHATAHLRLATRRSVVTYCPISFDRYVCAITETTCFVGLRLRAARHGVYYHSLRWHIYPHMTFILSNYPILAGHPETATG